MPDYITLKQAASRLDVRIDPSTVWRWTKRGIRFRRTGVVVRLECVRVGSKLFTTEQWLRAFLDALEAAHRKERQAAVEATTGTPGQK